MSEPRTTLRLRGISGPVEAQIHFPTERHSGRLVVAFVDPATGEKLSSALGAIVIGMSPTVGADTQRLLEWIAAHAAELGASADSIAVTGIGDSVKRAAHIVAAAALAGWPPLELLDIETALPPPALDIHNDIKRDGRKER